MKKLEFYFDYTCPFCYRGWAQLNDLLSRYPNVEIIFYPCEAHPKPEYALVHSDLASQVCIYLQSKGLDVIKYSDLIFKTHFEDRIRIDDVKVLSNIASQCGADAKDILEILKTNTYDQKVKNNNYKVWEELQFEAVPSYRLGEHTACSTGGRLVDLEKVKALIS